MKKNIWSILEIEPTTDLKVIKKAYSKLLKETDVNDIEKFQNLKEAFDLARKDSKRITQTKDGHDIIGVDNVIQEKLFYDSVFSEDDYTFKEDQDSMIENKLSKFIEKLSFCDDETIINDVIDDINQMNLQVQTIIILELYYDILEKIEDYSIKTLRAFCEELKVVNAEEALKFAKLIDELPEFSFYQDPNIKYYNFLRYNAFNSIKEFELERAQEVISTLLVDFPEYANEVNTLQVMLEIIKQQVSQSPKDLLVEQFEISTKLLIENPDNQTVLCCYLYLAYLIKKGQFNKGKVELIQGLNRYYIPIDLNEMKHNYLVHDSIYTLAVYQLRNNISTLNEKVKDQIKEFEKQRIQKTCEEKNNNNNQKKKTNVLLLIIIIAIIIGVILKLV